MNNELYVGVFKAILDEAILLETNNLEFNVLQEWLYSAIVSGPLRPQKFFEETV
jgi:hypothetical protein